jgi:hypothetical protein
VAKNILPDLKGYLPIKSLEPISSAFDSRVRGAHSFRSNDGTTDTLAGTLADLYRYDNAANTWTSIKDTTYGGNAGSTFWSMAQFGDNAIMTNGFDPVKTWDTGTTPATVSTLGGSPPKAKIVFTVKDHLVLANLENNNSSVHWSAVNDSTGWTTGTDLSDSQTFPDGGPVMTCFGGEYGTVFQQTMIRRMVYAPGSPEIFQISVLDANRGSIAYRGAVQLGPIIFYLSNDGFYMLQGNDSIPIGYGKVNSWFFDNVSTGYTSRTVAGIDLKRHHVWWSFISNDNSSPDVDAGACDKALIYNWVTREWTYADIDISAYLDVVVDVLTLEDLDSAGDIDSLTVSLDSGAWNSEGISSDMSAFNGSFKFGYFTGPNMEATLQYDNVQLYAPERQLIRHIVPYIDSADTKSRLRSRESIYAAGTWGSFSSVEANGECPHHTSARMHDFEIVVPSASDWTHAIDFFVDSIPDGLL